MQTRTSQGQNFQDSILDNLRARRAPATLYLNNRMALHGRILDFDPYVLLLEPADGGPIQMVYKSAVVSVTGPPPRRRPPGRFGDGPRDSRPREGGYRDREGRPGDDRGPRPEWRGEGRPRPQGGGYGGGEGRPRPQGGYEGRPRPYGDDRGPRPQGGGGYGGERRGPWQERPPRPADGPPRSDPPRDGERRDE